MITLFITDIDGCLAHPFESPDWEIISQIRELNRQSKTDDTIPDLSICSGRPLPYVEAVAQWLDVTAPVVFESGGVYELAENRLHVDGVLDDDAKKQVDELKQWVREEILAAYPDGMIEFSKMMDAGFIHPEPETVYKAYDIIKRFVNDHYPDFEVHHTDVSVNVILSRNNKRAGIRRICSLMGITPSEVAYIGDSSGDIPGFEIVGKAYAPENAKPDVKKVADVIPETATKAVLEAYSRVIHANKGNS